MISNDENEEPGEGTQNAAPDFGDIIDQPTFDQILEMDDDEEEREFSRSIVYDFFTQAESTFDNMDQKLTERDLPELSALGHFLKGSSATLGLTKVKDSCEKIQHFGAHKDATGNHDEPDDQACLDNISKLVEKAKTDFHEAEKALRRFYNDEGDDDDDDDEDEDEDEDTDDSNDDGADNEAEEDEDEEKKNDKGSKRKT